MSPFAHLFLYLAEVKRGFSSSFMKQQLPCKHSAKKGTAGLGKLHRQEAEQKSECSSREIKPQVYKINSALSALKHFEFFRKAALSWSRWSWRTKTQTSSICSPGECHFMRNISFHCHPWFMNASEKWHFPKKVCLGQKKPSSSRSFWNNTWTVLIIILQNHIKNHSIGP